MICIIITPILFFSCFRTQAHPRHYLFWCFICVIPLIHLFLCICTHHHHDFCIIALVMAIIMDAGKQADYLRCTWGAPEHASVSSYGAIHRWVDGPFPITLTMNERYNPHRKLQSPIRKNRKPHTLSTAHNADK